MRKFLIFFCTIMFTSHVLAASVPGWYNTNKRITITCDYGGGFDKRTCTLDNNHNLTEFNNCAQISGDPFNNSNIIYIKRTNTCDKLSTALSTSGCPYIEEMMLANAGYFLIYCATNENVTLKNVNRLSDSWTQEQKKCVASGGTWKDNTCDCSKLPGTKNIENECICTNPNQKYYNGSINAAGCETLKNGIRNPQGVLLYGFYQDLSQEDKRTSCGISGGEWGGINNNVCECKKSLNMERDSSGYFCNCKQGYEYIDPFFKDMGCTKINDTPTNNSSEQNLSDPSRKLDEEEAAQEETTPEPVVQATPPLDEEEAAQEETTPEPVVQATPASGDTLDLSECENSGGTHNADDTKCTCAGVLEETVQTYNGKQYSICKCVTGYKRENGKYTDQCVDAGDTVTEQVLDTEKMRVQAEAAYQSARDHEQSIANRALTAGTTLTTGASAMAAASALAEQKADRKAEADMRDYLATFKCEYGNGQQKNAGNEEITLPGGNELLEYYTEYKTLADNVKQTKGALGLRAGIESETLYDRAQTELYQYSTAARTSTGQISLARALSDETSADAAAWNEQKAQTRTQLNAGLVATATGVVSGIVGNQLINRKYRPEELKDEFTEITRRLEREYPQTFMPEPIEIKSKTDAITMPEQTKQPKEQLKLNIPPVSGTAFEEADFELNTEGKKGLDAAITQIINTMNTIPNSIISIHTIGHTDMLGISAQTQKNKGYKTNQELSEKRSATVSNYLKNGLSKLGDRVHFYMPTGQGDTWCRQQNKAKDDGDCRRVDIDIKDLTIYE